MAIVDLDKSVGLVWEWVSGWLASLQW